MAISYPHKQTLIITAVCAIIVIAMAYHSFGNTTATTIQANVAPIIARTDMSATNTPNTDWKSAFIDSSSTSAFETSEKAATNTDDGSLTFTAQFGRNLFSRVMLLNQDNLADDPDAVKTVIDQTMTDLIGSAPQPKIYSRSDIILSSQNTLNAERSYGNIVGSLFYTKAPHENAATIAEKALDDKDPTEVAEISNIVSAYTTMITTLRKTPVPESLADYHVDLLNGLSSMLFVSDGMGKVFSDPAQSIVALNMYSSAQDTLHESLLEFKNSFTNSGITFSNNEGGVLFSTIQ